VPGSDADSVVQPIRLRLLGGLALAGPDGNSLTSVLAQPKRVALLAYLALGSGFAFYRRDSLLPVFWPEFDQERARSALRRALHFLRQSLGEHVLIRRGDEEVGLNADRIWCDAVAFRSALGEGRLDAALALYGELLPGFFVPDAPQFEQWLDEERARLRSRAARAAALLSERLEAEGALADAIVRARTACTLDPASEPLVRRLVTLLARSGDRAGAVHAWDGWKQRLENDYGIAPGFETRQFIETCLAEAGAGDVTLAAAASSSIPLNQPAQLPDEPAAPPTETESKRGRRRRRLAVAGALGLLIALLGAAAALIDSPQLDPKRVLVVGFANETSDSTLDNVGRLAADWISNELARSGLGEVTPPEFLLSEGLPSRAQLDRLLRETRAGTVIQGALYWDRNRLRFHVHILDGRNLVLRTSLDPILSAKDSVTSAIGVMSQRITGAMAVLVDERIPSKAGEHISRPPAMEAYQHYVRGRNYFQGRQYAEAHPHFLRAFELDTSFLWASAQAQTALINMQRYAESDSMLQLMVPRREQLSPWDQMALDFRTAWLKGDHEEALRVAQARFDRLGGPLPAFLLGLSAINFGRPALAIKALEATTSTSGTMDGSVCATGIDTRRPGTCSASIAASWPQPARRPGNILTSWKL
jgi:serine/threonine-protein kinase